MEKELIIKCGKNSNSSEELRALCLAEAEILLPDIKIENGKVSVPCWTDGPGFAELIGVALFGLLMVFISVVYRGFAPLTPACILASLRDLMPSAFGLTSLTS
ncbi:MAG: hypothetical protein IKS94_02885 [Prevotella sp.]|nr:hypothetical protein [Prevotella sp.]